MVCETFRVQFMVVGRLGTMASLPPPPSLRLKQSLTLCSCNLSVQIAQVFGKRLLVDIQTLPIRARIHWGPRHGFGCMRNRNLPAARSVGASLSSDSSKSPEATDSQEETRRSLKAVWNNCQMNAGELRARVAKLGRAGLLAYGLFNGITYTSFFVIAFLGFEKSTGQNPAANLKACLGVVISMWTGNNFTRPLRVAGAAAFAPLMDKVLRKTQEVLKLPDETSAFTILVTSFIALCFSIVGLLVLTRWGR